MGFSGGCGFGLGERLRKMSDHNCCFKRDTVQYSSKVCGGEYYHHDEETKCLWKGCTGRVWECSGFLRKESVVVGGGG